MVAAGPFIRTDIIDIGMAGMVMAMGVGSIIDAGMTTPGGAAREGTIITIIRP
jgi:hypothetical protein